VFTARYGLNVYMNYMNILNIRTSRAYENTNLPCLITVTKVRFTKECVGHKTVFTLSRPLSQTCFSSINIYETISSLTQYKFWFSIRIVSCPVLTSIGIEMIY